MEDWLRFSEVAGPFLFDGILNTYQTPRDVLASARALIRNSPLQRNPAVEFTDREISLSHMWDCLRDVVHFVFRVSSFTEDERQAAQTQMLRFSILAEALFPVQLCMINLHALTCHLWDQIKARGAACRDLEFWIERLMQDAKSNLKVGLNLGSLALFVAFS